MKYKDKEDNFLNLSKEFHADCGRDEAKKCILFSKIFLESLCVWPGTNRRVFFYLALLFIINQGALEIFNAGYVFVNITDLAKCTAGCTSAIASYEGILKMSVLLYYKKPLNKLLVHIWKDFWPAKVASVKQIKAIKIRSFYITSTGVMFFIAAFTSASQYMVFPLYKNIREVPFLSAYPFNFTISPRYELLYVWQLTQLGVVIPALTSIDNFIFAVTMIYATQFIIMQDVIRKICSNEDGLYNKILFGKNRIDVKEKLMKFIDHHVLVLNNCKLFSEIFTVIIFFQFVLSTVALCVPCIALVADPELFENMLSYFVAHLLQFFIYCSVGNELMYQSNKLAEAAYNAEWHLLPDNNFRKSMVLIINRSQKTVSLNIGGLFELSYANFIATLQLSFSFYTLLDSFVERK